MSDVLIRCACALMFAKLKVSASETGIAESGRPEEGVMPISDLWQAVSPVYLPRLLGELVSG